MKVLIVKPHEHPFVTEVENKLEALQGIVGGYIEALAPFEDPVILVCDEEGKVKGKEPNRYIKNVDIIVGTFFLCGQNESDFDSLTPDLINKYTKLLWNPHRVYMEDGMVHVEKEII